MSYFDKKHTCAYPHVLFAMYVRHPSNSDGFKNDKRYQVRQVLLPDHDMFIMRYPAKGVKWAEVLSAAGKMVRNFGLSLYSDSVRFANGSYGFPTEDLITSWEKEETVFTRWDYQNGTFVEQEVPDTKTIVVRHQELTHNPRFGNMQMRGVLTAEYLDIIKQVGLDIITQGIESHFFKHKEANDFTGIIHAMWTVSSPGGKHVAIWARDTVTKYEVRQWNVAGDKRLLNKLFPGAIVWRD